MHTKRNTPKTRLSTILESALVLCCLAALCAAFAGCAGQASSSASKESKSSFSTVAESSVSSSPEPAPQASQSSSSASAQQPATYSTALQGQLQAIADSTGMNVGITFIDLANPAESCHVNDVVGQRSASMIKLLVLNEFYNQVSQGLVSRNEGYTLTGAEIVGGTGVLQGYGAGYSTTFGELADLMISQSDNTASNIIVNRLGGMGAINARAAALGLTGSNMARLMMDTDALARGIDNYMSAQDAATLLQMIYTGTFVDQNSSRLALTALEAQSDGSGILGGLPGGVVFAHKTGTLSNAQNDAGIVEGAHPYVLSVFCETGSSFSQGAAFDVMQRCGSCVSAAVV